MEKDPHHRPIILKPGFIYENIEITKRSGREIEIKCACGNSQWVRYDYIAKVKKRGIKGCLKCSGPGRLRSKTSKPLKETARRKYNERDFAIRQHYAVYKSVALRRKKISFDISFEEFLEYVNGECYYCGRPPYRVYKIHTYKKVNHIVMNGIDRIDSNLGYENLNIRTCCTVCNQMKSNLSENVFLEHVRNISKKLLTC